MNPPQNPNITLVDTDKEFTIKSPCPYCKGKITAIACAWEEDNDGTGYATDVELFCSNEPDLDEEEAWDSWDLEHGRGDNGDAGHHLHERIIASLKAEFRFKL
jgi:hypothetical protein